MKRLALLLAVLLAGMFAIPAPAQAAATTERQRIVGASAFADFVYGEGEIVTYVNVIVNDTTVLVSPHPGGPEPNRFVSLSISRYNQTTGEVYISAFGATEQQIQFTVARDLSTAHLAINLELADLVNNRMTPASVDLTWHATSARANEVGRTIYHEHGYVLVSTFNGAYRDSSAIGTIDCLGENVIPGFSSVAQIQDVRIGSLTVIAPTH